LNYLTDCGEITFYLTGPGGEGEKYSFTFYHVASSFNSMLPSFNTPTLKYPFVGGAIELKVSDMFFGTTFLGEINFERNLPTFESRNIRS
jgi:hypothetical protein